MVMTINAKKMAFGYNISEFIRLIKKKSFKMITYDDIHVTRYIDLPLLHKDPFDRMLISIAITENLTILTHDKKIQEYDIKWLWG
jgi:PIN domain nuclease of toxin-antitoxin system